MPSGMLNLRRDRENISPISTQTPDARRVGGMRTQCFIEGLSFRSNSRFSGMRNVDPDQLETERGFVKTAVNAAIQAKSSPRTKSGSSAHCAIPPDPYRERIAADRAVDALLLTRVDACARSLPTTDAAPALLGIVHCSCATNRLRDDTRACVLEQPLEVGRLANDRRRGGT